MTKTNFSQATQERIDTLKQILKGYQKSIKLLNDFADGKLTLKGKDYSFEAESYTRTKADEGRLPWTLNHIKAQIRVYENELEALQQYGR